MSIIPNDRDKGYNEASNLYQKQIEEVKTKINDRIDHLMTLGRGYGVTDKRIAELRFTLNLLENI